MQWEMGDHEHYIFNIIKSPTMLSYFRKQPRMYMQESKRTNWLKTVFLQLNRNTELAQAVHEMMLQAERIYILMIKVKKLFPFLPQCFLKEIENMFSMFLSSYDDTLVKV